jgi:uncharacterized protein
MFASTTSRTLNRSIVSLVCANFLLFTLVPNAIAQERKPLRTLTVNGRGIVTIDTTLTQAQVAVEVQGKTPASTQQLAAQKSAAVVAYLKAQRVEKIKTTGINLNPIYNYPPAGGQPQIKGYTATNSVSFRISNDRAGNVLDGVVKAGATRIDSVSFVASDAAIAKAQVQALKAAALDAQSQGDALLSALNLKRKEITGIQVTSSSMPVPIAANMEQRVSKTAPAARDSAPTPVEGGEQQVEASVMMDMSY